MPTITDLDNLLDASVDSAQNIYIDTAVRTIKIRNNEASANPNKGPVLDNTGVTLQALYSKLKKDWKDDPKNKGLINYPFPLVAITPEQFEWRFGWAPADDSSRDLIRTAGWREFAIDDQTIKRQYIGVISLGNIQGDQNQDEAVNQHTVYYGFFNNSTRVPTAGPFDFTFPGEVNQAVLTYKDSDANGTAEIDRRSDILRLFIRSQPFVAPATTSAWTFDQTDTTDIGLSAGTTLPFNTQRFPLVEGVDLNIPTTLDDATIRGLDSAGEKFSDRGDGPTIQYLSSFVKSDTLGYTTDLLNGPYRFGIRINNLNGTDGTSALTNQEIYSWTQYKLRQDSDIEFEAGTVKNGKLQDELLQFVGSTLKTKLSTNLDQSGTKTGVAVTPIATADINNIALQSDSDIERSFPFSAGVTISFSQDILNDSTNAKVFPFYTYTREYGGTSVQLSGVGPAVLGTAGQDSADFTLTGFSVTPVFTAQNPEGLNPAGGEVDQYFRLAGASTAGNNTIWRIRKIVDSNNFSAYTYDDDPTPGNELINTTGVIRNHPINSPGAIKIDSAGEDAENTGTDTTLLPANLTSSQYVFSYAFDVNSQKDRKAKDATDADNVAITIRAIGLENGSWVETTGTIERANNNAFSVVSAVERNYSDPA